MDAHRVPEKWSTHPQLHPADREPHCLTNAVEWLGPIVTFQENASSLKLSSARLTCWNGSRFAGSWR